MQQSGNVIINELRHASGQSDAGKIKYDANVSYAKGTVGSAMLDKVDDAPNDHSIYVRQDNEWKLFTPATSGGSNVTDIQKNGESVLDSTTGIANIDDVASATTLSEVLETVDLLVSEVFPLKASYTSANNGTYEVGVSVTPTVAIKATRKGTDVSSEATVTAPGTTPRTDGVLGWYANGLNNGSVTYSTTVSQGGLNVNLGSLTWSFTYYRYRGAISSIPTDYGTAIKALSTKELSTSSSLGSTSLAANKYYLFAVKGDNISFTVKHALTGGIISGCITGTTIVSLEAVGTTNTYSYVLIPASVSSWNFTIN